MLFTFLTFLGTVSNDNDHISLWTILVVLAIIALLVFIFRNIRR